MKTYFVILITLFITSVVSISSAYAHILVTDKSIGAVLHINPEDDPIVGQQSSFFFEFKDKENKFTPDKCDCTFAILQNGKAVYSQALFQDNTDPSLNNASIYYTFQSKNVYQIRVTGKPLTQKEFQAFTLNYDIRVERADEKSTQNTPTWLTKHLSHFAGIIVLAVVAIIMLIPIVKKSINKSTKGGDKNEKDSSNTY